MDQVGRLVTDAVLGIDTLWGGDVMVSFVIIGLTFYLFSISKTGFIPDEDQGLVFAFTEAQQGIAFQDMRP